MEEVSLLLSKAMTAMHCGAVILTKERRVHVLAGEASHWLGEYFDMPAEAMSLPEELDEWISHQEKSLSVNGTMHVTSKPLEVARGERRLTVQFFAQQPGGVLLLEERGRPESLRPSANRFGLTSREGEVLYWVAQGKTNIEIAMILALSARTVSKHLEHIYQKMGVETRTAAALSLAQ